MRPRALVAVAALLAVSALAGCGSVRAGEATARELRDRGYDVTSVDLRTDHDLGVVAVTWRPIGTSPDTTADEEHAIAAYVWTRVPYRVDGIELTRAGGSAPPTWLPRSRLESDLGPRPAGLDDKTFALGEGSRVLLGIGAGLAFVVLGALRLWLWSRRRVSR